MRLLLAALSCSVCVGCLPRVGPPVDGGTPDAATPDGGQPDAGLPASCADGQRNGTETGVDCGGRVCGGCADGAACTGPLDCQSLVCTASQCRPPASSCPAFAGCVTFDDATAPGASRNVTFPNGGERYAPRCLRVRLGQTVTFNGASFAVHPLRQACGPTSGTLSSDAASGTASFTFDTALGVYGYYCGQHGSVTGSGMAGAIEVVR